MIYGNDLCDVIWYVYKKFIRDVGKVYKGGMLE
jgi:hypothetical protein